jgi:thiol-disulfide isomerase/thioredoxin
MVMKKIMLVFFFVISLGYSQDSRKTQKKKLLKSKPIVLVFSGSDWCAPCIKLDKSIWQSTEFKDMPH